MPHRTRARCTPWFALAALGAARLGAQSLAPSTTATVAATGLAQLDAPLNGGGSFSWNGLLATFDLDHQFSTTIAGSLSLRYELQRWHFADSSALGAAPPWGAVNLPQVSATIVYTPKPYLRFSLAPTMEWDFESRASTADALDYGAVVTAGMAFSRNFFIGIGAGIFYQVYETHVYPFPLIYWKISDRWKVTNAFTAGPAGGAGVEARYAISATWEAAAGGSYRTYTWRLAPDAPEEGGIGQNRFIPLFLRVGHTFAKSSRLDLYGAVLADGQLTLRDPGGALLSQASYSAAPAIGLTFRSSF